MTKASRWIVRRWARQFLRGVRSRARGAIRRIRDRSVVRVEDGPARGILLHTYRASGDYRSGSNELPVQHALTRLLRPGSVFYDVGSNIGFFALLGARLVGETGLVYAFEPVRANAKAIIRNAALNRFDWLQTIPIAVSDHTGHAQLLIADHPGGATLSRPDIPQDVIGKRRVSTASIDDLVRQGRITLPDVVKIDVEGAEEAVLRGLQQTLIDCSPIVVCELDASSVDGLSIKVQRFLELFGQLGYAVEVLPPAYDMAGWHVWHCIARRAE